MDSRKRDSNQCSGLCAERPDAMAARIHGRIYVWTNPRLSDQEAKAAAEAVIAAATKGAP